MRKTLLASVAILSLPAGMAMAQERQDQIESAYSGVRANAPVSAAGSNNNNNVQAAALPGPTANPTPGTFVIRLGARVNVQGTAGWSNLDSIANPGIPASGGVLSFTPAGGTIPVGNTVTGITAAGVNSRSPVVPAVAGTGAKRNPYGIGTYMRLYPGLDAMATNGLRYGAGTEIRTNFGGNVSGGSGASSGETLFMRRAFIYAAGDKWGLVRIGQADGVIGLFDGGVTTGQNWSNSGVLNGGDAQTATPGRAAIPFYWMSLAGNEYASNKIVYISPKIFGVEAGVNFTPATGNNYSDGGTSPYTLTSNCAVVGSTCYGLSSSSAAGDANRYTDLYEAGLRYLDNVGPVNVRAYGVYVGSGQVSYTGVTPFGSVTGLYNNLSVFNAGAAVTYAGFTLGANWIGGAMNGQYALKPAGGANLNATTASLQYVTGALTLGVTGSVDTAQGAGQVGTSSLVGRTQLGEQQISTGGRYVIAPGLSVSADYIYMQRRQNGYNFQTATINPNGSAFNTNSQTRAQSVVLGVAVNW